MHIGLRVPAILLAGVLALVGTIRPAYAGSEAPEVGPQWMQRFSREVFSADTIRSRNGHTWLRLDDGNRVLFSAMLDGESGIALLARRFAADGDLLQVRLLPSMQTGASSLQGMFVAQDPANGDVLVLAGSEPVSDSPERCVLLRLDAAFGVKSVTPIGSESGEDKGCSGLELLEDGSAIVAFGAGLARVDSTGNVVWTIDDGADGHYLKPRDMLLDQTHVIWIASRGGADLFGAAAIVRFDLAGKRLSEDVFVCNTCSNSMAQALILLDDGSVVVGGNSEWGGQPGFIARYISTGQRMFLRDTEENVNGMALLRDGQGAVFAWVDLPNGMDEVRRIDKNDGAALWSAPATDFAAASNGVVVTRTTQHTVTATGFDANGTQTWDRVLAAGVGGEVSRGRLVDGRTELLLRDYAGQADCGIGPQILAFDAAGTMDVLARPCRMPASTYIRSFDAVPGLGALAGVDSRLVAYTPDGDFRWEGSLCPWCPTQLVTGAQLTPDGGGWGLAYDYESADATLTRYDSSGEEVISSPIDLLPTTRALFGYDDQAIVVQTWLQTLIWHGLVVDSGTLETREHHLSAPSFFLQSARGLPGGEVSVALEAQDCAIICPPEYYLGVVRLATDGSILWHYEAPEGFGWAALDAEGGANVIVRGDDAVWRMRGLRPDGTTEPDVLLPAIDGQLAGLYGPIADRLLLVIDGGPANFTLWSIDAEGAVLATRTFAARMQVCDDSPLGLLMTDRGDLSLPMLWIDPLTLETRAQFRLDPDSAEYCGEHAWRMLADGTVYGTDAHLDPWNLHEARLARFTAPGYTPTELIYRNGFD